MALSNGDIERTGWYQTLSDLAPKSPFADLREELLRIPAEERTMAAMEKIIQRALHDGAIMALITEIYPETNIPSGPNPTGILRIFLYRKLTSGQTEITYFFQRLEGWTPKKTSLVPEKGVLRRSLRRQLHRLHKAIFTLLRWNPVQEG